MTEPKSAKNHPYMKQQREKREDLIHSQNRNEVVEKMYNDFKAGIAELQKRMDAGETDQELAMKRKKLGENAWALQHVHGYDLKKFKLKSLGVELIKGEHISRGSR